MNNNNIDNQFLHSIIKNELIFELIVIDILNKIVAN